VSRSYLSLFEVDAEALSAFSAELRAVLVADDRDALVRMLSLEGEVAGSVRSSRHAVFTLLEAEEVARSGSIFESLRRAARDRALRLAWKSDSLALEGRLRGYDALRDDAELARLVDALLDGRGVPWFLRRPGATFGSLSEPEVEALAAALVGLQDAPPELVAFGEALGELEQAVLCHDTL
jgi:hypothetical protein